MQSNCRLKWKRGNTLPSPAPEIQSHPLPSLLTWWQTWHKSFFHMSQFISSRHGLTTTGATASQEEASQSSGPFQQQPKVISAEAQREPAPTGCLQDKRDYMQSSLKTKSFHNSELVSLVKWYDSPLLESVNFMNLVVSFLQAARMKTFLCPVPKMHWVEVTWTILRSLLVVLLLYFSWKI